MERAAKRGIEGLTWQSRECRDAELRRRQLRRLHHRLRHPERHRHPRRAARSAPRAQARRALLLPRILDQRMARLRQALRALLRRRSSRASARPSPATRTAIATSSNRSAASPSPDAFRAMIADAGFAQTRVEPMLGGAGLHLERLEDLTARRHPPLAPPQMGPDAGAPRRAAGDRARSADPAQRPPPGAASRASACAMPADARLCRRAAGNRPGGDQARPGAGHPSRPGRRSRPPRTCSSCRTISRPSRSRAIKPAIEAALGGPVEQFFRLDRPDPGRRRLDRAGPPRGHHRGPRRRDQGAPPGHRGGIRPRASKPTNGPRPMSNCSAARPSGSARGWSSLTSSNGSAASST